MDTAQLRDLLNQVQAGARVSTAIGEPIQVGDLVVIPVAEVAYGGGAGGGKGGRAERGEGEGGGGGGGVRVSPMGCWVIGPDPEDARWVPAVDVNRALIVCGAVITLMLLTIRALVKHK